MIPRAHTWTMGLLALASIALSSGFAPYLPESVPTHWNLHGEADEFGSPWTALLLFPGVLAGLGVLLHVLPILGPFRRNFEQFAPTYGRVAVVALLTILGLQAIVLMKSAGLPISIGRSFCIVLGLLFAALGNWMGKLRRNFYVGIRTPWTLANEAVWERTHRLGGKLFTVQGVLAAVVGLFAPDFVCFLVLVGGALGVALWTVVYSYLCYRQVGEVDDLA